MLRPGRKVPVFWPPGTGMFEKSIVEVTIFETRTVIVMVVLGANSIDVVYGGIEIVVADVNRERGRTKTQGGWHCAGVPVQIDGPR